MKQKTLFLVAVIFTCITTFGQRQPDVVIPFEQAIQQILLNPANGHVIVKEKNTISDYNPETKKTEWTIKKDDVVKIGTVEQAQKVLDAISSVSDLASSFQSDDALELIPNSDYIRASIENRDIIINSLTGEVVFNSGKFDYRIMESQFLPEANEFLFLVSNGKIISYVLWDLKTGAEGWKTELGQVAGLMSSFKSFLKNDASEDKSVVANNAVYASLYGTLYKLDRATGQILWQSQDKINTFYLTQSGKDLVIIKNSGGLLSSKQALNIWKTEDGSSVWKDDIKTKYVIYLEDWSDKLLVAHNSGFNFYSYADGKKIWKKDVNGSNFKQVIAIGNDYLYIADKEMMLVDNQGKDKWKKAIEISDNKDDAIYYLGKVDNNRVFYLTDTYGNMVDYTSGKKIWKKNIEFDKNRPLLYAQDDKTKSFLVYNDKKIYKFDPNVADKPEPIAKLKEIKDDKSMASIELFNWGICLTGQSDVIGTDFGGKTLYNNTYKEPGATGRKLLKAAAFGLGAAKGISETKFYMVNEKGERISPDIDVFNKKAQDRGALAGDLGSVLSKKAQRFNALKQNSDYAFVLNKGDQGPELVKVKKADGKEVDKIALDSNKPVYETDPVDGSIYYVSKNELRIFK